MDEFEKDYKLEDTTQKAESESVDDLVRETVNEESTNSESLSLEDTNTVGLVSEKLEEEEEEDKVALDSVNETEPALDLTKPVHEFSEEATEEEVPVDQTDLPYKIEQSLDETDGVFMNSVSSKGIDSFSLSGQNGDVSPMITNVVPKAIDPALDENNKEGTEETTLSLSASEENPEESSKAADLQSAEVRGVDAVNDRKDSNMSELPESTENQPFIAVIPRPLQRTSWSGCCGLFEVLRHSDQ